MEIEYGVTRFHKWTILREDTNRKFWFCRCDCGTERRVNKKNLKQGLSRSCNCFTKATTHGMSGSRTYSLWQSMRYRVKDNLKYVELGIKICDRWQGKDGFANFLADVGECPPDKKSLDRYPDPFGNYEPGNCRWADDSQQQRNKTNTKFYEYDGKKQSASDWAEQYNMSRSCFLNRVNRGWSMEAALNTPQGLRRGRGTLQTKDRIVDYRGREQTLAQWAEEFQLNVSTMIDRVFAGWSMQRIENTPQGSRGGYNKGVERNRQIRQDASVVQEGAVLLKYVTNAEAFRMIANAAGEASDAQMEALLNVIFGGDNPVMKIPGNIANKFCVSDHRAERTDVPELVKQETDRP